MNQANNYASTARFGVPNLGNPPMSPTDVEILDNLPARVRDYVDLYPIKGSGGSLVSSLAGYTTSIYRATNQNNNQTVCLRRVHAFQPTNAKTLIATYEHWRRLNCSNMVQLLHVFSTSNFGDTSLVLVYQYFPQATTLMQQYFNDPNSTGTGSSIHGFSATNRPYSQQNAILKTRLLPENLLWHYIVQIASALRVIHCQNRAYQVLDLSNVLITSPIPKCPPFQLQPSQYPRIRLNTCGMLDIVTHPATARDQMEDLKYYQQFQLNDLEAFGRLCLALATNSIEMTHESQWEAAFDLLTKTYSKDLKALIRLLISAKEPPNPYIRSSINDVMPIIGARFFVQLNLSYDIFDSAQAELEREALNGKLFRLLVKLSMINDRPELRLDPSWSETGDRYMLKLFREYLFHQVNEDGTPWLDTGHVVSTLMKFDTGSPEKICLISRDEQHVLVVSFAELKKCFENAFADLRS